MTPSATEVRTRRQRRRIDIRRDAVKIFAALAVLLVMNLAVWYTMIKPRREAIRDLESNKVTASNSENQARKRLARLRDAGERANAIQQRVDHFFDVELSTKAERFVSFQRAIEQLSRKFKVRQPQVSIQKQDRASEEIEIVGATFPLTGGYENLRSFLAELEELDQFIIVREVSISGAAAGGNELLLNVAVETYFSAPGIREQLNRSNERSWRDRRSGGRGGR